MGEMGWSPRQFWYSPLPDFFAALRGHRRAQKEHYRHTGEIVAAIYNVNRDTKTNGALEADDIFPFLTTVQERIDREFRRLEAMTGTSTDEESDE